MLGSLRRSRLARVFTKFAAGSAVATGCSQVTFLLLFGVLGASATVAGALAFLAGAVPNFVIQRYWTWQRSGRIAVRRELAPYVAVIAANGVLATAITAGMDRLVSGTISSHALHTAVLSATLFASFVLLFVAKFLVLDRVFRLPPGGTSAGPGGSAERGGEAEPVRTG